MKIVERINFEDLNDDTAEMLHSSQEKNCKSLYEELKNILTGDSKQKLKDLYDELGLLTELSNSIYYKLGMKKAVNIFIDGSVCRQNPLT